MKRISKRLITLLTASVFLFGCSETIISVPPEETDVTTTTTEVTTKSPFQVELPEIQQQTAQLYTEAENSRLFGNLRVATKRRGYAGNGYVTGFDGEDSIRNVRTERAAAAESGSRTGTLSPLPSRREKMPSREARVTRMK